MRSDELYAIISKHVEPPERFEIGRAVAAAFERAERVAFARGCLIGSAVGGLIVGYIRWAG